jgi:hypothetical protein
VSAKVEVFLVRLSDSSLGQRSRQSNGVLVTTGLLWEESDVVTHTKHHNVLMSSISFWHHEGTAADLLSRATTHEANALSLAGSIHLEESLLHGGHLLIDSLGKLAFGNIITEVDDGSRGSALANLERPAVLDERHDVLLDVLISDHLNAVTVGLDSGSVTSALNVHRDSHGSHVFSKDSDGIVHGGPQDGSA